MRLVVFCLFASTIFPSVNRAQVPVFKITPGDSSIKFFVKASVALEGNFKKWDAALTFTSPDVSTGVLEINIQADTVNTGSGIKDGKLKSEKFFNVKEYPVISFLSKKIVQTGPDAFEVQGDFTIRGVSKRETLVLTVLGAADEINGTMAFDRRDYGMDSGIPFIKIADRIEVIVNLKAQRISGPPVALKPQAAGTMSQERRDAAVGTH